MNLGWYARRLSRMSPSELAQRARDQAVKVLWRRLQADSRIESAAMTTAAARGFATPLPREAAGTVPDVARAALLEAANELLDSRWRVFSRVRSDLGPDPDWFIDISTDRRAPDRDYALGIDYRDADAVGQVKYVWELARHQHLTVLGAAFHLTGDERYARRAHEHLASWWRRNPFLTGIHWTSGIEIGLRLLSWVWLRRLLNGWQDAPAVFERNPVFVRQVYDHQRFLATLPSHHSSANNHLLAEAAGLFAASCAFPFFTKSETWRSRAADTLRRELPAQTYPCGHNRELATGYHLLALELGLAAAIEGEVAGHALGDETWQTLARMLDALAAIVDGRLRPPRQGDSDDAHGLLMDAPQYDRVASLLASGRALVGGQGWWPRSDAGDVRTAYWAALVPARTAVREASAERPAVLTGPGLAFLRVDEGTENEVWCRCDHGELGFLATAAHGHADALSLEVRADGVDILADPGTYRYQGSEEWRRYFRSTRGHNTLEIGGVSQSVDGGPFMWTRHAGARLIAAEGLDDGERGVWEAEHDGYARLHPPAVHRRRVELDRESRSLTITDTVVSSGEHDCVLSFHLGPDVRSRMVGGTAELRWDGRGGERVALLALPSELAWQAVQGREDPPLGWYSSGFDAKSATTTLVGSGRLGGGRSVLSRLTFCADTANMTPDHLHGSQQWT